MQAVSMAGEPQAAPGREAEGGDSDHCGVVSQFPLGTASHDLSGHGFNRAATRITTAASAAEVGVESLEHAEFKTHLRR